MYCGLKASPACLPRRRRWRLAFPAIFVASATLVEKHERERKQKRGLAGRRRGTDAAALDAAGAALGTLGLVAFGSVVWWLASDFGGIALLWHRLHGCWWRWSAGIYVGMCVARAEYQNSPSTLDLI